VQVMTLELSPCRTENRSGAEFTSVSPADRGDESATYDIGAEAVSPDERGAESTSGDNGAESMPPIERGAESARDDKGAESMSPESGAQSTR
jgi:hypothetical protein